MVGIVCVVKGVSEIVVGVLSFVVLLLNGLISDLCCYSVVKVFFVDVEQVCWKFDVIINDVVFVVIMESYCNVFIQWGEWFRFDLLCMLVLVLMCFNSVLSKIDNCVLLMLFNLLVD